MIRMHRIRWRRTGKILVLSALLMPALLGFVALAVDLGLIATAQGQMRTVADAAALAGARQLASQRRLSALVNDLGPEIQAAQNKAVEFSLEEANQVLKNSVALASGDIVVGYKSVSPPSPDTNVNTAVSPNQFNSVQVTVRRDEGHVGPIPPLFSRIWGHNGTALEVTSTATIENYSIQGFSTQAGANASLLPFALNKANYDEMMAGNTTDQYSFNPNNYNPPSSNGVSSGPDGIVESKLFPVSNGNPGNWGTINIGVTNNGNSTLKDQILNGIPPAQLKDKYNNPLVLNGEGSFLRFGGNPGMNAGMKGELEQIIGKPVAVAIYDHVSGNGNNTEYRVVAFGSVRIVAVDFQGSNKHVIVQPAYSDDPTVIPNPNQTVSWTQGGVIRLHLSR